MTAALEPARASVDQLVSIQIDLNTQAGSVALSVESCGIATFNDFKALQEGYTVLLKCENDDAIARAASPEGAPGTESGANRASITNKQTAGLEEPGLNTSESSGPATPEQADTIGVQEEFDDERPSSSTSGRPSTQQCALGHRGNGGIEPLTHAARGVGGERFTCPSATAGESNDSGPVEGPRLDPANTQPAPTPARVDPDANPGAGEGASASAAAGLVTATSGEKVEARSGPLPSPDGDAGQSLSVGLSVLTPSAVDMPASMASELSSADVEPVTPTTPPRQPPSAPLLPPPSDPTRMTLVLDLDGTLIASEDEPHAPVPFDYCVDEERFVWLRPGLRRFLDSVRPQFEVVLFTAAGESWATSALQRIDPDRTIFDSRLYRDHTVSHDDWPWVKDLSRLGRDLARVVIVDDNPLMFMYQPDNALHVAAYDPQLAGRNDDVLEQVLDVLMHKVLIADDVREVLRNLKEPITASCMAARHAAAKAAASVSHTPGRSALTQGMQARKVPGSAAAAAAGPVATASATTQGASGASQGPPGTGPAGIPTKLSRRARRSSRQQRQEQGPLAPQGLLGLMPRGVAAAEKSTPTVATAGAPPKLQSEKRQRRQRSRRPGGGAAGASGDAGADSAAAAAAGAANPRAPRVSNLAAAAAPLAATQRPPVVVTRIRAPKHALKGGAVQLAGPSPLQKPEQQLQLKLKLLQLQREQEEEDGEGLSEGEDEIATGRTEKRTCEPQRSSASQAGAEQAGASDSVPCGALASQPSAGHDVLLAAAAKPSEPSTLPEAALSVEATAKRQGALATDRQPAQTSCGSADAVRSDAAVPPCAAKGGAVSAPNAIEQKPRSRRRRRPAGAAGQASELPAPTARVAVKASAADGAQETPIDGGNDLVAVAARRVLQDLS